MIDFIQNKSHYVSVDCLFNPLLFPLIQPKSVLFPPIAYPIHYVFLQPTQISTSSGNCLQISLLFMVNFLNILQPHYHYK